jgi:hypothetical protein
MGIRNLTKIIKRRAPELIQTSSLEAFRMTACSLAIKLNVLDQAARP